MAMVHVGVWTWRVVKLLNVYIHCDKSLSYLVQNFPSSKFMNSYICMTHLPHGACSNSCLIAFYCHDFFGIFILIGHPVDTYFVVQPLIKGSEQPGKCDYWIFFVGTTQPRLQTEEYSKETETKTGM